jgi:ribose transport system permease protein
MREAVTSRPGNPLQRIPGVAVTLLLLVAVFGSVAPGFLSAANITNILLQSTVLTMLALPMTLIIMTEGLDLSMGAVLTLTSLVVAIVSLATGSMWLGLGAAILAGTVFGILNGWLVAIVGIPPFVATLGTLGMAQGLSLIVSDGQSVVGIPHSVRDIYSANVAGVPVPVVMALASYAAFHVLLYHTRFGTYIFALGGNREALKYAGLAPSRLLIAVYAIGGMMAGVAGLVMTARMNSGHPTAGLGLEFDAIAAVAVGGTSFEGGNGWLFGTALGVIAVGVLRNGLNLMALPSSIQVASVGLLVIVALFFDGLRSRP